MINAKQKWRGMAAAGMLAAGIGAGADDIQAMGSIAPFQDGDRIACIGDSITCAGLYHFYIKLFYTVRYPQKDIRMFDCGIGGDDAPGAFRRMDWDIMPHNPNQATIMLGANDADLSDCAGATTDDEYQARRQARIADYRQHMSQIVQKLNAANVAVILLTPSPYDQTAQLPKPAVPGYNETIGMLAGYVRQMADEYHTSWADFNQQLLAINARQQKLDPAWTIIGPDRIHPGPAGHLAMAYIFLKCQEHTQYVARLEIDAKAGAAIQTGNCAIANLKFDANTIAFNYLAHALPFPLPANLTNISDLIPFQRELNDERLAVAGLPEGQYTLTIDGRPVGAYSSADLARGINLADNRRTPQFQQAESVFKKLYAARQIEAKRRMYARVRHLYLAKDRLDYDNAAEFNTACQKFLEKVPKNDRFHIYEEMIKDAVEYQTGRRQYEKQETDLHQEARRLSRTEQHVIEISPAP